MGQSPAEKRHEAKLRGDTEGDGAWGLEHTTEIVEGECDPHAKHNDGEPGGDEGEKPGKPVTLQQGQRAEHDHPEGEEVGEGIERASHRACVTGQEP